MKFTVIDKQTGKKPNLKQIAIREAWAQNLLSMDMDGFMVDQDGGLYLVDDCNNMVSCPEGRFQVEWNDETRYSNNEQETAEAC